MEFNYVNKDNVSPFGHIDPYFYCMFHCQLGKYHPTPGQIFLILVSKLITYVRDDSNLEF